MVQIRMALLQLAISTCFVCKPHLEGELKMAVLSVEARLAWAWLASSLKISLSRMAVRCCTSAVCRVTTQYQTALSLITAAQKILLSLVYAYLIWQRWPVVVMIMQGSQ